MTGITDTSLPWEMEDTPDWPYDVRHYGIERLLDWGFAPFAIARVLGCSKRQIAAVSEQRSIELS